MNVLWLVNVLVPEAAEGMGLRADNGGSWIVGQLQILKTKTKDHYTVVCVKEQGIEQEYTDGNITYKLIIGKDYREKQQVLQNVLEEVCPDLVHIFGTEMEHTKVMQEVAPAEKTLISIQGLTSFCLQHYFDGMAPYKYRHTSPLKYLAVKAAPVHGGLLAMGRKEMLLSARRETHVLCNAKHVAGRTDWDKACVRKTNPNLSYHHYGEILRPSFYHYRWEPEKCKRHSIFVSQGGYPIKGLHMLLRQMPYILREYPDAHLTVAGQSVHVFENPLVQWVADYLYEYQAYCKKLIRKLGLVDHVTFTGPLNEGEMRNAFLNAHVSILPSSIENSPNSLGEAMLLGVPCIASFVGGVPSMLEHKKEGFLYPFGDADMLPFYINQVFSDDELACRLGQKAHERAAITHAPEAVTEQLLTIYERIHST